MCFDAFKKEIFVIVYFELLALGDEGCFDDGSSYFVLCEKGEFLSF